MSKHFLFTFFVFFLSFSTCFAINEVKIRLFINPTKKTFSCDYKIILSKGTVQKSFAFNINKQFTLTKITSKSPIRYNVKPYFDSFQKDTLKRINMYFSKTSATKHEITIKYTGKVPERFFTKEVIELSAHANWLPNIPHKEYEIVNYQIEVSAADEYKVMSTTEPIKVTSGKYYFKGNAPNIEITALAATKFNRLNHISKDQEITTYKAGKNIDSSDSTLQLDANEIISYYNKVIGKKDPIKKFTILLPGTNRDAFGLLDNAIDITYTNFNSNNFDDKLILAHEISHKWWGIGQWDDYNNWLNEAFATYSSLLYIKTKGDTVMFKKEINKRINSSKGAPAIMGFDVKKYDYKTYRKVIYDKGTIALFRLHEKLGNERFFKFLSTVAYSKIVTTEQLLKLIEKEDGKAVRRWFRDVLIYPSNPTPHKPV